MLPRICIVLATLILASAAAAQTPPPSYTSTEIGSLQGGTTTANAINNNGDIVGSSQTSVFNQGAFVYHHASRSLSALNGAGANGINDYGKIVGEYIGATTGPEAIAWYLTGGSEILPSNAFAMANAVSNDGQAAGNVDNGHAENLAVMWAWKPVLHITNLGVLWVNPQLPSYATSTASAINGSSHIVGSSDAGTGNSPETAKPFGTHAFLYRSGLMEDLGALYLANDGSDDSGARGINNADDVVGSSTTNIPSTINATGCPGCKAVHAFLWHEGHMSDLGNIANVPGWDSQADAINDQGEIVGWANSNVSGAPTKRAFVYTGGHMYNLTFNVYARDLNVRLTEAVSINCNGWIVANGYDVRTPTIGRVYLLVRRGPLRTQCPAPH